MAQYKVLERSFIGNMAREPGDVVELEEGIEPGTNLELIEDKPAKGKAAASGE